MMPSLATSGHTMNWSTQTSTSPRTHAKLLWSAKGHADAVVSLAFSADRRLLATGSKDGTGNLWDASSSKPPEPGPCFAEPGTAFAPWRFRPIAAFWPWESRRAKSSCSNVAESNSREIRVLRGGQGSIDGVAFSSDGKYLAGGGEDQTLRVWEPGATIGERGANSLAGPYAPHPIRNVCAQRTVAGHDRARFIGTGVGAGSNPPESENVPPAPQ